MCSRGRHERAILGRLTMIPPRASLCNGKASFRDAAERLPRKEPNKAFGALFVDVNAPAGLSSPAINKTVARQSRGGTGAQNRGCPHPGTPAMLHSVISNTFVFWFVFFLQFPGFEDWAFAQQLHQKQKQVIQAISQAPWLSLATRSLRS